MTIAPRSKQFVLRTAWTGNVNHIKQVNLLTAEIVKVADQTNQIIQDLNVIIVAQVVLPVQDILNELQHKKYGSN